MANNSNQQDSGLRGSRNVQLSELNNRGRHYTTQLWQLPFAYLSIEILSFATHNESQIIVVQWVVPILLVLLGYLVRSYMQEITRAIDKCIKDILEIEKALGLSETAKRRKVIEKALFNIVYIGIGAASFILLYKLIDLFFKLLCGNK